MATHVPGQFLDEDHEVTLIQVPLKRSQDAAQPFERWYIGALDPNSDVKYKLYGPNNVITRLRRVPINELNVNQMREEGYTDAEVLREVHRRTTDGIPIEISPQPHRISASRLTESDFLNELLRNHDSDSDETNSEVPPNEWSTLKYQIQQIRSFKMLQIVETVAQQEGDRWTPIIHDLQNSANNTFI